LTNGEYSLTLRDSVLIWKRRYPVTTDENRKANDGAGEMAKTGKKADDRGAKPLSEDEAKEISGGFPGEYYPAPSNDGWGWP